MTTPNDLSEFWCWNKECPDYGKKGQGNIRIHDRIGKDNHLLLKCKSCKKTFSELRGTSFFRLETPRSEVLRVLALLPEKGGIRALSRATGHKEDTIAHWIKIAGAHSRQVNEYFLHDLALTQVQIDELWSYIKKRTKLWPNGQ